MLSHLRGKWVFFSSGTNTTYKWMKKDELQHWVVVNGDGKCLSCRVWRSACVLNDVYWFINRIIRKKKLLSKLWDVALDMANWGFSGGHFFVQAWKRLPWGWSQPSASAIERIYIYIYI